ncbi:hypothetical protein J7337_013915 [Fusarium musae]|uniref:Uncharacterized protein n=1 Tax=Fusarium musae TaxID=1042133 RepID=A0A9P8D3U3_9HYPO|nr:hypothetical protein J7337_013915 [Fusarium musae]KAG9494776.1 hypothetical protein J7337_013915 [Fusarium musae]
MDEPEPKDKNIEIKVWQATIAAMEEHIGTKTRQEGIFVRAALILMDGSTRSVYDNQDSWAVERLEGDLWMGKLDEDCAVVN